MPRFKSIIFYYNSSKISYFCKKMQNFLALGGPPPDSRASCGWGFCSQIPSLWWLEALPPDPKNSPPLRFSGYASACSMNTEFTFSTKSPVKLAQKTQIRFGGTQKPLIYVNYSVDGKIPPEFTVPSRSNNLFSEIRLHITFFLFLRDHVVELARRSSRLLQRILSYKWARF